MEPTPSLHVLLSLLLLLLLLHSLPPSSSASSSVDPNELSALKSMKIPTTSDPCSNATICDASTPPHLLSLRVRDCSDEVSLSTTAFESLTSLIDLEFINCPASLVRLPPELASNLRSFTCIRSLPGMSGVWLSRLSNVTDLTVSGVNVTASGPSIILNGLQNVNKVTISGTNLPGSLPKSWHPKITYIDLSQNQLKGHIPSSISDLQSLISLDFSSNQLDGELPTSIGDLSELKNLSLSSNSLSGPVPASIASIPSLIHLDLSSNQFNGSVPEFLAKMKNLKYLNLEKNNFQGVMPFGESFIQRMLVFKIGGNANLCYNHSSISSKVKLGIAPCDKNGFPITAEANSPSSSVDNSGGDDDASSGDESSNQGGSHGPNKVVLGVAIALSCIVLLIIFLIILAKRCT